MWNKIIALSLCAGLFFSCASKKMLEEAKARQAACESELSALKKSTEENAVKLAELKDENIQLRKRINAMKQDSSTRAGDLRSIQSRLEKMTGDHQQLLTRYNNLVSGADKDNAKLSNDLHMTKEQLLKKQDELSALGTQLENQKRELDAMSADLQKREARVKELEEILRRKDEAAAALRKKLSEALVGFENKGLTITQKNGKVYVSMEESLLFQSGKTAVEEKGVEALKNLAKVLEQNTDINVMVEGHTDDVPMKGAGEIKDNWDLSVMRATSVTKILLNAAKIDPQRVTPAGRGEYLPLDKGKTPEARKKNRRTEIILSPKLDELMKILGEGE